MKITAIINGVESILEIPLGWKEVTFESFLKIQGNKVDPIVLLSKLWEIEEQVLRKSKIVNFDSVVAHLNSLAAPIDTTVPKTLLDCSIPQNLNFDEVGRYWDIKHLYDSFYDSEGLYTPDLTKFPIIVTAAIMPGYCDQTTTPQMQDDFAAQVLKAPCGEVLAIANFCLTKLALLRMLTAPDLHRQNIQRKNFRQGLTNWVRNLVLLLRLKYWSLKLRSTGTK